MNYNRISFRFAAGEKEADRFIDSLMSQLCFDKTHNVDLDVEEHSGAMYRHVALKDTRLKRKLLCFHEDHGVMIFTVGVPFTMLSSVEHGEERCYEFELDLTLYQEVVSMTHPLRLAVPASARIYAS